MKIKTEIKGVDLTLETSGSLFSPGSIDLGTLAMLSEIEFDGQSKVLDLGCGYGVVGILAAKIIGEENVVMCDVSNEAVALAQKNAALNGVENIKIICSNGFENVDEINFSLILSNPPYHEDFSVAKGFIENGFKALRTGGQMVMVTKRLLWYKNKLTAIFGGVRVTEKNGYYVFVSEKRKERVIKNKKPPKGLSKKLRKKQK